MSPIQLTVDEIRHLSEELGNTRTRCCVRRATGSPSASHVTFDYLNKGAANIIFRIQDWTQSGPATKFSFFSFIDVLRESKSSFKATPMDHQYLMRHVLRVPRGGQKHLSSMEIIHGYEHAIRPLFLPGTYRTLGKVPAQRGGADTTITNRLSRDLTKHLMDHEAVLLLPDVMSHLYTRVEKSTFANTTPRNCWGILLPNMSPTPGRSITLEIKPKWLAQSPNAPSGAIRCRTCAMQVSVPKNRASYICPLQVLHGDSSIIRPWAHATVTRQFGNESPSQAVISTMVEGIVAYLTVGDGVDLLRHLLQLQSTLDPWGVLCRPKQESELFDYNLRLAMTLRDCSLFIKINYNVGGITGIESKLGDLDFKSAEKIVDWMDKERQLLNEGAYLAPTGPKCWIQQGS
ncbi:inositol-pentakisphosphate 2-kinase protein [Stemphylium lycopersici]|uniref:Inositol-pentakisphosphate 2-kinase n=1 Tax=Stemphylium lycopersici TaxID=183478 RepID=A0A364N982_STELY|nr:inositol-pentakisphosphate 2-kinase protein [Stemphylium lycopersici]RAR03938.1 inositol-pentakisphosphate 2-kinase protein [Stemphylium lycopersici]RAR13869.1 inositol-pentakisphosphate 2-kinase protein [Stemphylium lycopersici]